METDFPKTINLQAGEVIAAIIAGERRVFFDDAMRAEFARRLRRAHRRAAIKNWLALFFLALSLAAGVASVFMLVEYAVTGGVTR